MTVVAVVGAQWGDEGKGKVIEAIAPKAALVVQYAGGYSPGQTLVAEGERFVLHVVPSGSLRSGKSCLLAQGMALDPRLVLEELEILETHGALAGDLRIDQRAQVVLPHHIALDQLREESEGASGSPRRGIGPAYMDAVGRRGIRMGDLLVPDGLEGRIAASIEASAHALRELGAPIPDAKQVLDEYVAAGEKLRSRIVDGSRLILDLRASGEMVVLEGPFGTMVDQDHGYYPFVVGASTVAGGACTGTGISPKAIDRVIGVAKAYITRPGLGPLPSEVTGDLASTLQDRGGELSPTSARPRRCGMFDVPVLRYSARVNGFDELALTKLDVLSGLDEIPVCVGYELDGDVRDEPPFEGQSRMQPLTEMLPGWTEPLSDCRAWEELPANARGYVEFIERNSGVRITLVSVGPDKAQTIRRDVD
ncbi:MAG: adenylosuccinate synthase [Sandaracinaceae bacterium]|nr:adenylosuccinate synthase [Sandaracinaceae bacterium]